MKRNNLIPGLILIAVGVYFLLQQFEISLPYSNILFAWPSILGIIGLILAYQGYSNRNDSKMFSGIILLGLGVYFHGVHTFNQWSNHWAYFTLIVSIAFFMKYFVNKREGLTPAFILLFVSAFGLYSPSIILWMQDYTSGFEALWPVVLIAVGIYFLFIKKR